MTRDVLVAALVGITSGCGARSELPLGEVSSDSAPAPGDVLLDVGDDIALPDAGPPQGQLAASKYATFVVSGGIVRAWGRNFGGELGLGDREDRSVPTTSSKLSDIREIAAGEGVTCFRDGAWKVWCVGLNEVGELGIGTTTKTPVIEPTSPLSGVERLFVRGHARISIVRRLDGSFAGWGYDDGELGIGVHKDGNLAVPSAVAIPAISDARDVTVGNYFSCALHADATVTCTGSNRTGQLGDGTTNSRTEHAPVKGLTGVVKLWSGFGHTCALRSDESLWCWGANGKGQLGDGSPKPIVTLPVRSSLAGPITQISAGVYHTCALRPTGEVLCWGGNAEGQLGDGTSTDRLTAQRVDGLPMAVEIALGWEHSCARTSDDAIWCWGGSRFGQVGNGTSATRVKPVKVWPN